MSIKKYPFTCHDEERIPNSCNLLRLKCTCLSMINIYKRCETKSVVSKQKNKSILCCRCNISQNFAAKHVKAMKCKNISFSFLDNIRNAPYKTRPYNLFATPSLLFSCPVGQRTVALYNMQHVTLTFVSPLLLLISSFTFVLAFVVFLDLSYK